MANKDQAPFDIPDPEAAGWKEDPDRPGYWLWENEQPVNEAPIDGLQYGRQDADWTEIVIPASHWEGIGGGINTNASKVIVGTEGTEGVGLYANGSMRVWETAQNNNYLWTGYGGATITSHIQADGDAKFSGQVDCGAVGRLGFASFGFSANVIYGRGSNDVAGGVDLGTDVMRWADGYFSGTVNTGKLISTGIVDTDATSTVLTVNQNNGLMIDSSGTTTIRANGTTHSIVRILSGDDTSYGALTFGDTSSETSGQIRYTHSTDDMRFMTSGTLALTIDASQNARFYGSVTANAFAGDGSGLTNMPTPDLTGYIKDTDDPVWLKGAGVHMSDENGKYFGLTGGMFTDTETGTQIAAQGMTYDKTGSRQTKIAGMDGIAFYKGASRKLRIVGSGCYFDDNVTAPDFTATSDERLKKNIETVQTGLVDQIRGVEFEYIETNDRRAGVIAQEVEAIDGLSHLVYTNDDDDQTKSVSYLGLIPYLIEEVKALKAEVRALKDAK